MMRRCNNSCGYVDSVPGPRDCKRQWLQMVVLLELRHQEQRWWWQWGARAASRTWCCPSLTPAAPGVATLTCFWSFLLPGPRSNASLGWTAPSPVPHGAGAPLNGSTTHCATVTFSSFMDAVLWNTHVLIQSPQEGANLENATKDLAARGDQRKLRQQLRR